MQGLNWVDGESGLMSRLVFPVNSAESTRSSKPGGHFGRSKYYYVADTEDASLDQLIENTSSHFGGQGSPVDLIVSQKPDAMISIGMGPNAKSRFQAAGVPVFKGDRLPIAELIERYRQDALEELTELCEHSKDHHH